MAKRKLLAKKKKELPQTNGASGYNRVYEAQQNKLKDAYKVENKKAKIQSEWDKKANAEAKKLGYSSLGQARKQGGNASLTAIDTEYGAKKNPYLYATAKGLSSGLSAGLTDVVEKKVAPKEIKQATQKADKSLTKGAKRVEKASEIAGSFIGVGKTIGASKAVGKGVVKGAGKVVGKDLSEEALVKRLTPLVAKNAEKLSVKSGTKITAKQLAESLVNETLEDIGMNVGGWGQAQAVSQALLKDGDTKDKLKEYGKAQLGNIAIGIPANRFIAGKGAINKARALTKLDDVLNPDLNLYAVKKGSELPAIKSAKKGTVKKTIETADGVKKLDNLSIKERKNVADLKQKTVIDGADTNKHYSQSKNGLLDREEKYQSLIKEKSTLEAKKRLDTVDKAKIEKIDKQLKKIKTPDEWKSYNEAKITKIINSADNRASKGYSSAEMQKQARTRKPAGQRMLEEELTKKTGKNYTKTTPPTFEEVRESLNYYNSNNAIDEKGKRLSKTAFTSIFQTDNAEARKIFTDLVANTDEFKYDVRGNKEMLKASVERVSKDVKAISDFAKNVANGGDWKGKEALEKSYDLYTYLKMTEQELATKVSAERYRELANEQANCLIALKTMASSSGQVLQLRKIMVDSIPENRLKVAIRDVAEILMHNGKFLNKLEKETGFAWKDKSKNEIRKFVSDYIVKNDDYAEPLSMLYNANSESEISDAYEMLMREVNAQLEPTILNVIQEWRYLSMLGNAKTHGRNIIGNAIFGGVREISNSIGAEIENALAKSGLLGENYVYSKAGFSAEAWADSLRKEPITDGGKLAKELWEKMFSAEFGKDPKYDAMLIKDLPKEDKNIVLKFINKASELNSKALEKEDFLAMQHKFRETFAKVYDKNISKLNKEPSENLISQIEEIARDEAIKSTFREPNEFADVLTRLSKDITDPTVSISRRGLGLVANTLVPFAKTPANVLKQAVNFSPVGLIKGTTTINKALKSGNANAIYKAIEDLGAGLTGTGIALIGWYMGRNSDLVTSSIRDNNAGDKFAKNNGKQAYSIQIGNKSYTLDWLTPTITSFFAGVQLAKGMEDIEDKTGLAVFEDMTKVVDAIVLPVLETSMLSGLKDTLDSVANDYSQEGTTVPYRLLSSITDGYINSMIPTLLGQLTRTLYKTDKQIVGENDLEYNTNRLKSKAGLANIGNNPLGEATNAYGEVLNEKETIGDYAKSAFNNFLNPANVQTVTLTDEDKQMIADYNEAIASGMDRQTAGQMFPRQSYTKTFTVGKKESGQEEVKMSNKNLSQYNQGKQNAGSEAMKALVSSTAFKNVSAERKQEILSKAPKDLHSAVNMIVTMPEYKALSAEERSKLLGRVINTGGDKAIGSIKAQELSAWKDMGRDEVDYLFANDLTARLQNNYKSIANKVSKKQFMEATEKCLSPKGSYTIASMTDGLNSMDLTTEQKILIFNALKDGNTKRGYGSSSSGKSSGKSSSKKINKSAYTVKQFKPKSKTKRSSGVKIEIKSNVDTKKLPPKLEKFEL